MAKITRYDGNFKAFGSDATGTERTVFGSTTQTDDLTTNLGAEYQRGWGVLPSGQKPPKQYFNGALFGTSQAVAYLHQMGVAEWNSNQEYHIGSIVNRSGVLYTCKTNNHTSATTPENDPTNWSNNDTIINNDNTPNLISAVTRKSWTKGVAAFTGIIAIEITGLYNQSAMNGVMEVDLMEVGNTKRFRKLVIHGQWNNGTSAWDYGFANDIIGGADTQVRFARNTTTSKVYVLLGETTTSWTDTRVVISVPVSSWNSGLNLGFAVSTLGSLTGITTDFNIFATQAANLDQVIGVGQTWQEAELTNTGATFTDGSSKFRALGVNYTNSTGKPIVVMAHTLYGTTGDIYGYVAPHNIVYSAEGASASNQVLQLIVPNGTQYSITKTSGIGSITKWYELR